MKPIYWSPVQDIASVQRATWFYKDDMMPIEPPIANQLETGYAELKPWTETWSDELNSAVEAGAEGEDKVVQRLWPFPSEDSNKPDWGSQPVASQTMTSQSIKTQDAPILCSDP